MTVRDAPPAPPAAEDQEDKHRLTALEGLAALSLDALSSVAYGPEAIVIVLAAAGTAGLALIPEVQPEHWWRWFLHNQRGFVLNRAVVDGTDNVVVCRLRFRLRHLAPDEEPGDVPAAP